MEIIPSRAVIVVAPGYPAELVQELLSARILPLYLDLAVLLPPERTGQYDLLMQGKNFYGVRFLPSPGRRFFSTTHLTWLRGEMKSKYVMLLIPKSPFQDLAFALVSLSIILWSCKTITFFRATEVIVGSTLESVIDANSQSLNKRWLSKEINQKNLDEEIRRRMWKIRRRMWWVLYFLMFAGLIIRRYLSVFSPLVHKLRGK